MRREILMPPVTPSMTDGKIARWHVAEGQSVAAGDLLVEVATPTATLEIEAEGEGRVERILVPAGTEGVKVNTPIAILLGEARAPGPGLAQPLGFASLEPPLRREGLRASPRHGSGAVGADGALLSYREALRDALTAEMEADETVFVIGVDVAQNRGAPTVTQGLVDAFGPSRVVAVPALDEAVLGMAVGAAFAGLRPVVALASWGRTLETLAPVLTSAAQTFYLSGGRLPVPVVFRGPNGLSAGVTGEDARCVAAALARIPGLKIAQPATPSAAKVLLQAAIRDSGPVAVLEHEQLDAIREAVPDADTGTLGVARIARTGTDVTLAAAGHAVVVALEAAAVLARDGIDMEVVDLMCVRPLDRDAVAASGVRTGRLVTLEDGWGDLGLGAEIVASVAERGLRNLLSAPLRITGAPVPMPYAPELQALAVPGVEHVARAVAALVRGS